MGGFWGLWFSLGFFSNSGIDLIYFFFLLNQHKSTFQDMLNVFFFQGENSGLVKKALHSLQTQSDIQNVFSSAKHQKERSVSLGLGPDLTILR